MPKNLKIKRMNINKNRVAKFGIRQLLFVAWVILFLIFTSCASANSAQSSRHSKPASTGKRKCGCSMLTPATNQSIKLYQQTDYALQA
jgi:hypothetical protein